MIPTQQLQISEQHQIVPAEGDTSPKRPRKTTLALPCDEDSFWRRIQETVAGAVSSSIVPLQEGLAEVSARTSSNEEAISRLDSRFAAQMEARAEEDRRLSARLDDLQAQVVDLQKASEILPADI